MALEALKNVATTAAVSLMLEWLLRKGRLSEMRLLTLK